MQSQTSSENLQLSFRHLLWFGFFVQAIALPDLWQHTSTQGSIFGRYSIGYALVLAFSTLSLVAWASLAVLWHQQLRDWITRTPPMLTLIFIILLNCGLYVLISQAIERQIAWYVSGLVAGTSIVLVAAYPAQPIKWHSWWLGLCLLIAVVLVPIFITAQVLIPFSPDEAVWADKAATFTSTGQLLHRTSYHLPYKMQPGIGWITGFYGILLQATTFDIGVGRILVFLNGCLIAGGVGLVAARLYGRWVGFASAVLALLSLEVFMRVDYRPDKFVALAQLAAFYAAIVARQIDQPRRQAIAHFCAGLLVTFTMQAHASGLGIIIGLSLFYLLEALHTLYKEKRLSSAIVKRLIYFGCGAGLGTLIYFITNIWSVGGLDVYLSTLINERGSSRRVFHYLFRFNYLNKALIWAGLIFIILRRNHADRLYLSLFASCLLGITLIDTQGYAIGYLGLVFVPIGVPIMQGLSSLGSNLSRRSIWVLYVLSLTLVVNIFVFVRWDAVNETIAQGNLPSHFVMSFSEVVVDFADVQPDEVLVASQELIWRLPYRPDFYSTIAEGLTQKQRGWTETQVWDAIRPDVYIEMPTRLPISSGLRTYLDDNAFEICKEDYIMGNLVRVYRLGCG